MTTMVPCINIGRTEFLLYIIDCLLITCPPQYLHCPPMVRLLGTGLMSTPRYPYILTSSILLSFKLIDIHPIHFSNLSYFHNFTLSLIHRQLYLLRHTLTNFCTSLSNFSSLSPNNTVSSANINQSTFHSIFLLSSHVCHTNITCFLSGFFHRSFHVENFQHFSPPERRRNLV